MAIKKIVFTIPKSSLSFTAIGGIRFYDKSGAMIPSGTQVSTGATSGETQNFLTTASSSYKHNTNYYMPFPFDTNKVQLTNTYTSNSYWLTDSADSFHVLTVEFKTPLDYLSKIEFVPRPDSSRTDRGIDSDFTIDIQDETYSVIQSYNVTPITAVSTVQTLDTEVNKILILSSNGDVVSNENDGISNNMIYVPDSSEQNFINYGLDKGTEIDLITSMTNKVFIEQSPTITTSGKLFIKSISKANKLKVGEN